MTEPESGKEEVTYFTSDGNLRIVNSDRHANYTGPKMEEEGSASGEKEGRQAWGGKAEFLFSCLSYAVGLGNVWRFPYLCYKNGGGAFLIPFVLMLACVGIPLMFLETCFGQYSATGPISVWKASPLFTGIGWSMCLITFSGSIYYNMLIAWTLFYLYESLKSLIFGIELPWSTCKKSWAAADCMHLRAQSEMHRCNKFGGFFSLVLNNTCLMPHNRSWTMESDSSIVVSPPDGNSSTGWEFSHYYTKAYEFNSTNNTAALNAFLGSISKPKYPSHIFFHDYVLDISKGFSEIGAPQGALVLCLLVAWVIVILALSKGVKTAGKAVYFTSLFPYFVLTVLIVRGLTLEGAIDGIKYFFIPKWENLLNPAVWGDAAIQVFFSLSSGWGGIIALSSYNKFHNNALLDAMLVSIGDGLTSVYAGMTVFCVLGYLSHVMNLGIEEVAQSGAGLAFVVYPAIVTSLPMSPLWATLFFAMLLTLGFGTMISNVNTIKTAIVDNWPTLFHRGQRPLMVLCAICLVAFLLGLPCTTQGGMYVLQLLDNYCCTYSVLVVGFAELMVITWVYGVDTFMSNVDEIMRHRVNRVWSIIWKFFSPLIILAVAVFTFVSAKPSEYGGYIFPLGADMVGAVISVLIVLPIPAVAAYKAWRLDLPHLSFWQRARHLLQPDREWGREMGRKPAGFYAAMDPAKAFESQQPLTATASFIHSTSTMGTNAHLVSQDKF